MRILITGARGQLATDLLVRLKAHEVTACGRDELDITNSHQVRAAVETLRPDVVINTAAFHSVDLCESEPEQSFLVNAAAPQRLAAVCRDQGAAMVHISTDYVFSGAKGEPYSEDDPVDPINVYGASKAAGELAVRATTDRHFIVRTTGLYGHGGITNGHGNFVERMLGLARAGKRISVVQDQILTPSATFDVAELIADLIATDGYGTYHFTNAGQCSWFEFAAEIFRLAGMTVDLVPIRQDEWKVAARRPSYSVLGHFGLCRLGLPEPRNWQRGLEAYLRARPVAE
jgi:dTDP-4-dehydrorhamnose reductase